MTKKISNADLLWIFRERMASFDGRFKAAPIAILPSENGWEAVTAQRYRNAEPQLAKRIAQIQAELRTVYRLARDRHLLISFQLAFPPMCVFAIGIEYPLMMPVDRLQHSHLRKDHRAAMLGRPRHQISGRLHFLHFVF